MALSLFDFKGGQLQILISLNVASMQNILFYFRIRNFVVAFNQRVLIYQPGNYQSIWKHIIN